LAIYTQERKEKKKKKKEAMQLDRYVGVRWAA
jgi:hypothetical protein